MLSASRQACWLQSNWCTGRSIPYRPPPASPLRAFEAFGEGGFDGFLYRGGGLGRLQWIAVISSIVKQRLHSSRVLERFSRSDGNTG